MLINGSDGYDVLASYPNCMNVVDEVEAFKPDVILMDIDMPGVNGIEGLKKIREVDPEVKILMLTVFDDNKNIFQAISHGANGYIIKENTTSQAARIYCGSPNGRSAYDGFSGHTGIKNVLSMNNEKGKIITCRTGKSMFCNSWLTATVIR